MTKDGFPGSRPMEGQPIRRGRVSYEASKAHDEDRARSRELMLDMIDYVEGRNTAGAKRVTEVLAQIAADKRLAKLAGDPLRLLPEHRKVAIQEAKEKQRQSDSRRKKNNKKKSRGKEPAPPPKTPIEALFDEEVVDPGSSMLTGRSTRTVKSRGYALRGLPDEHRRAVERFVSDWELAYQRTLRGIAWTTKVDGGGGVPSAHIGTIDAQDRVTRLRETLGDRDYRILEAVAIYDLGPTKINAKGGPAKDAVSGEIRRVVMAVAAFYAGKQPPRKDDMIRSIDELIAEIQQRDLKTASGESSEESRARRSLRG